MKTWLKKHLITLIIVAILLVGLGLLLYPSVSDYWNSFHQSRAIMNYMTDVSNMDPAEYDKLIADAREYNQEICDNGINWKMSESERQEYESQLDFSGTGIMGYITIDKINVELPIYHGTSEGVLQTSIGHLEGSSLPVGCGSFDYIEGKVTDPDEGVHTVVTGHRGLPSAKLFSDLDKMVEGDTFTLNVLDETFTYQVDQIRIVEPTNLSDLNVERGQDLCTMVTCTPYGINTHRLLVRGHRVANAQGDMKVVSDAIQIESIYIAPFIATPILLMIIIFALISTRKDKKRKKVYNTLHKEK